MAAEVLIGYLSQDAPEWPDPKQRVIDVVGDAWTRSCVGPGRAPTDRKEVEGGGVGVVQFRCLCLGCLIL